MLAGDPQRKSASCLESVPIFKNLIHRELAEISAITTENICPKGQSIYRAGDAKEKLFVIHTGLVIRLVGPGGFIGELALFSARQSADYAIALENTVMCLVEGRRLKDLMQSHASIAFKIMEELSIRLEVVESRRKSNRRYQPPIRRTACSTIFAIGIERKSKNLLEGF
ncbi:MAG: cyclic nucleotide-binding domain-containing protein [Spirochaetales bacterium]|nr:cyclic nucleotide-binding domain-containing protein [Spirochaetales bacterium]